MVAATSQSTSGVLHFAVFQEHSPGHGIRAACGVRDVKTTDVHAEVTCASCRKTEAFRKEDAK